jgi:hypothetical protein
MGAREFYSLYQLPLCIRSVTVSKNGKYARKTTCINIDGIGVFVHYERKSQLDPVFIKKHKFIISKASYIIEALECNFAINRFFSESQGALIGGNTKDKKAVWIDRTQPILEFPLCPFMRKNDANKFVCGEPIGNGESGEFGMCVLENQISSHYCTLAEYNRKLSDKKFYNECFRFADDVFGYKVIRSKQVSLELTPMKFII